MSQGWITTWNTRRTQGGLRDDDLPYVSALRAAQVTRARLPGTRVGCGGAGAERLSTFDVRPSTAPRSGETLNSGPVKNGVYSRDGIAQNLPSLMGQ